MNGKAYLVNTFWGLAQATFTRGRWGLRVEYLECMDLREQALWKYGKCEGGLERLESDVYLERGFGSGFLFCEFGEVPEVISCFFTPSVCLNLTVEL